MRNFHTVIIVLLGGLFIGAGAMETIDPDQIKAQFEPTKPTVTLSYDVTYRFLFLQLMKVASAEIDSTEGIWNNAATGQRQEACFINFHIFTPTLPSDKKRGRICMDNRMVTVVTMPDMDTLLYMKESNEIMNPLFKKETRYHNLHIYDMQSGTLDFWSRNFVTNSVSTNFAGALDVAGQGKEVAEVLKMMSRIYQGKEDPVTPKSDFRIHINIEGTSQPFAADTKLTTTPIDILGERWPALEVKIMPAKEARNVKRTKFVLWATSIEELAKHAGDKRLAKLAEEAPDWGMTPLVGVYGLSIGYVRCALNAIKVTGEFENTNDADTSAPSDKDQ